MKIGFRNLLLLLELKIERMFKALSRIAEAQILLLFLPYIVETMGMLAVETTQSGDLRYKNRSICKEKLRQPLLGIKECKMGRLQPLIGLVLLRVMRYLMYGTQKRVTLLMEIIKLQVRI